MESTSVPAPGPAAGGEIHSKEGDKGLKSGALGYLSNLVIGVASTAPGYSIAATLGFITANPYRRRCPALPYAQRIGGSTEVDGGIL
jgi:hypothetical protein